jgi:hypothetical protein
VRLVTRSRFAVLSPVLSSFLALSLAAAPAFAHEGDTLAPAPVVTPPPPPPSPVGPAPARETPWPFVVVGVGALTLGTGIWMVTRDHSDSGMPACTTMQAGRTTCPFASGSLGLGWGVVAIGAQIALAGVAWRVYEVRHAKTSVSVVAGLGQLGFAGRF